MSVFESTTKIDRRYLSNKSRHDLEVLVMQLLDINAKLEGQAEAATRGLESMADKINWWKTTDEARVRRISEVETERHRYKQLLRFALRNCRRGVNYKGTFAWHMVSDLCGIGSQSAIDLCGELQIDPDALVQQHDTDDLCYVQEQRP